DSELANIFHPVRLLVEQHLTCDSELANILQLERLLVKQCLTCDDDPPIFQISISVIFDIL
ncbi:16219_t:CDS:2, partial [Funneliformis caledonium]